MGNKTSVKKLKPEGNYSGDNNHYVLDHSHYSGNNNILIGNYNKIVGNNNTIYGCGNYITGNNLSIIGNNNRSNGNYIKVKGKNNLVHGNSCIMEEKNVLEEFKNMNLSLNHLISPETKIDHSIRKISLKKPKKIYNLEKHKKYNLEKHKQMNSFKKKNFNLKNFNLKNRKNSSTIVPSKTQHQRTTVPRKFYGHKNVINMYDNIVEKIIPEEKHPIVPSAPPIEIRSFDEVYSFYENKLHETKKENNKENNKKIKLNEKKDISTEIEEEQCIICLDNKKCILYVPCHHVASCNQCAQKIIQSKQQCPICRTKVEQMIQVFI